MINIEQLRKLKLSKVASALFLPVSISIAILLLIRDSSQLPLESIHFNIPLVLLSFVVECTGLFIAIPVWRTILRSFEECYPVRDDVRIYSYSALGAVLPGSIWTIVGRVTLYQRIGAKGIIVTTASVIETLVIGISAMGVYTFSTIFWPEISLLKRPEIGLSFSILALLIIHPRVFNRLSEWLIKRTDKKVSFRQINYEFRSLAVWIILEIVVICIGGLAVFIFLKSLLPVSSALLIPIIVAWAAASVAGNLFFWLPGTPLLRDGAMLLALTPSLSFTFALAFVVLVRIWNIFSLLALAGLIWLFVDRPHQRPKDKNSPANQ